jgi:hypothetical protein
MEKERNYDDAIPFGVQSDRPWCVDSDKVESGRKKYDDSP